MIKVWIWFKELICIHNYYIKMTDVKCMASESHIYILSDHTCAKCNKKLEKIMKISKSDATKSIEGGGNYETNEI